MLAQKSLKLIELNGDVICVSLRCPNMAVKEAEENDADDMDIDIPSVMHYLILKSLLSCKLLLLEVGSCPSVTR